MRTRLPQPTDRITLGNTNLKVSPLCLGITGSPDTVQAAYEAGINFFFLTADLHWPLYENTREGLRRLLEKPGIRDNIVVGVVSYLDDPLFSALQFHEVINDVKGLERVDLLIAGAVSSDVSFSRVSSLAIARAINHCGAVAVGASFHQRPYVVAASMHHMLDISFIRYNTAHPGARKDIFPFISPHRSMRLYNFKSVLSFVSPDTMSALGIPPSYWRPDVTDCYRFSLSRPELDGILCSPQSPHELHALCRALEKPPLTQEEQDYLIWLATMAKSPVMV